MQIYFVKHCSKRIEKTNVKRGPDADNYHYFTWDNKGGTTGIAGEGTVCAKLKSHKTGITEWVHNEDEHYSETQCVLANIFFLKASRIERTRSCLIPSLEPSRGYNSIILTI